MAQDKDNSCATTSWIVAAIAGVAIAAMLMVLGDWRFIQAVFVAVLAIAILGFVLSRFLCSGGTAKADLEAVRNGSKGAATASAGAAVAAKAAPAGATATSASAATASPTASNAVEVKPSAALAGQEELASRKGEWKYEGDADAKPAAKKTAAKKPAAKKVAAKPAAAKTASSKAKTAKSDAKVAPAKRPAVAADGKPETLAKPRSGGADDLKLISGVGPKLEGTLNELGFWHFDQVAGWRKKEVDWVDSRLKFKGRIERDGWIAQAKILAKGGETEFSKKKSK